MKENERQQRETRRGERASPAGAEGMQTDTSIGDDDETDWFDDQ